MIKSIAFSSLGSSPGSVASNRISSSLFSSLLVRFCVWYSSARLLAPSLSRSQQKHSFISTKTSIKSIKENKENELNKIFISMLLDAWNSLSLAPSRSHPSNMKWFFVSVFAPNHVQCAETDIIIDWGNADVNRSRYKKLKTRKKSKTNSARVCHGDSMWNALGGWLLGLLWFAHNHRQSSANKTWITVAATATHFDNSHKS